MTERERTLCALYLRTLAEMTIAELLSGHEYTFNVGVDYHGGGGHIEFRRGPDRAFAHFTAADMDVNNHVYNVERTHKALFSLYWQIVSGN